MKKIFIMTLITILLIGCDKSNNTINVGFWNVENLFDLENDPLKNDDEFSLGGQKLVTQEILDMKLDHMTEVIYDLNVDILGLCEVENRKVLEMLNEKYPEINYSIVHYESPDLRGIDTALLYNAKKFTVVDSYPIEILIDDEDPSRDILYVKGTFDDATLHIFVNHWPSNYSGLERGTRRRSVAANILRKALDEILMEDENANIILMGDFNEDPLAKAVHDVLNSTINSKEVAENLYQLWNPMAHIMGVENGGTYKYRGIDNVIDQFIVSKGLIDEGGLELVPSSVKVLNKDKYRQQEGDFKDYPFRFWVGDNLLGGYSDHMAIHCTLYLKN
jgi:predicted extracellular nuclease